MKWILIAQAVVLALSTMLEVLNENEEDDEK